MGGKIALLAFQLEIGIVSSFSSELFIL